MATFKEIQTPDNIQHDIKHTFDVDLSISGDWGYSEQKSTEVEPIKTGMPLSQLQHMLTTIRAHLEMNITQEENNRYGGINANERTREEIQKEGRVYHKVTYDLTGIKEDLYNAFIKEYKAGYETEAFDLNDHFKRRKEATLTREIIHYFEVSQSL